MYKEICDYAKSKNLVMKENRKTANIMGYINLDENGDYEYIEIIDKKNKKSKCVPDFGSYSRTEKQANPICEKLDNILNKSSKKYASYVSTMQTGDGVCESLTVLNKFITAYDEDDDLRESIYSEFITNGVKPADMISFKIDGICIEDMESDWNDWLIDRMKLFNANKTSAGEIISSISGTVQESVPAAAGPEIKNVDNDVKAAFGLARPCYVAAAKENSYESYGFDNALGLQLGLDDAKYFAAGVEALLNNPDCRNKDFQLLYFYNKDVENIISESLNNANDFDDTDTFLLSKLLSAVKTGERINFSDDDTEYYMVQFKVPSAGRHYLSNEMRGKYCDLVQNLYKWYEDTCIINIGNMTRSSILKIYAMLIACSSHVLSDTMQISKIYESAEAELGSNKMSLITSVYQNKQIPDIFYHKALRNLITSLSKSGKVSKIIWLQIIKCYLIRKGYVIMPELNTNNTDKAYSCGRLFAVYEEMQYYYAKLHSNGKLNKNLSQKYFAAVMKQPAIIFPIIADLGNIYVNGIKSPGRYLEKIGELSAIIGTEFPKKFNDDEKGSFALGYYHQKADSIKAAKEYVAKHKNDDSAKDIVEGIIEDVIDEE